MKTKFLIIALLFTSLTFGINEHDKPTEKTLFGTEMSIENLVRLEYNDFYFYVAKNSPIAQLHKKDVFEYSVMMALHFKNYKSDFKYKIDNQ